MWEARGPGAAGVFVEGSDSLGVGGAEGGERKTPLPERAYRGGWVRKGVMVQTLQLRTGRKGDGPLGSLAGDT